MKTTIEIIDRAYSQAKKPCLAFSGGGDSAVLLDILVQAGHKPDLIHADSLMEYPDTRAFVEETAARYSLTLHVATPKREPREQWERTGWPMLGKLAARDWMQRNKDRYGFKINVSECCRAMKIKPARRLTKSLGFDLQFTGQRGAQDDLLRGLRDLKDGAVFFNQTDGIWIANPLLGWTDLMIRRYARQHNLPQHPARARGAMTIGCVFCGGGAQFRNSGYRALRQTWPEAWRTFMVDWKGGLIILALKYQRSLETTAKAVEALGGLAALADTRPWLFDYCRLTPMKGYAK
jgi:3'-phosphoadenosine 5'-phosphosulfate sulfotransferase (PAPS reductase)/FAD synthetase